MSTAAQGSAGRRVLVLGGTSEIALAIVRELQSRAPREVVLAGRDVDALERACELLRIGGVAAAHAAQIDARDSGAHAAAIDAAFEVLGGVDIAILAVGVLGERGGMPTDIDGAVDLLQVNVVGAGSLLLHCAERMHTAGHGRLVVLSSVAAMRPRRANAVYGASKAALDSLAQAIGDDLAPDGVKITVVRPGFVFTRMTSGLQPAPLATTPEQVAYATVEGLERGAHTVWAPRALQALMTVLGLLPRPLFRRIGA